jgi:anti-sigma regulatory factor (Ser/Thr protein kinase)
VATVTVSFSALPSHVRTARFIAASVARRAGVAENVLDEVRLAVSEACSLAVRLHRIEAPETPVEMRLTDDADQFVVQVVDAVARQKPPDGEGALDLTDDDGVAENAAMGQLTAGLSSDEAPIDVRARERIGLAVIVGLVDDVEVEYLSTGSVVSMRWPISQDVPANAQNGSSNLF